MSRAGFTLLELSIVIVIIGLIVASITAGQSLVQQANIRSVISTVQNWKNSITAFELAYGHKPGDLPNATSFWPSDSNVLNGNGDGYIGASLMTDNENASAWRHLSLSGLISENLPGTPVSPSIVQVREALPEAPFVGGASVGLGLSGSHYGFISSSFTGNPFPRTNAIVLVKDRRENPADQGVVEVRIAQNIDTKMDDGLPFTGTMISYQSHVFGVQVRSHLKAVHFT